eukprot:4125071-Pleurochrysis_carterae.AAC.2
MLGWTRDGLLGSQHWTARVRRLIRDVRAQAIISYNVLEWEIQIWTQGVSAPRPRISTTLYPSWLCGRLESLRHPRAVWIHAQRTARLCCIPARSADGGPVETSLVALARRRHSKGVRALER